MPDIFVSPLKADPSLEPSSVSSTENNLDQKSRSPFSALMINPRNVNFQDQDKDEEVLLLLRRHWVTNLPWIFTGSLMLLLPFIFPLVSSFLTLQLSLQVLVAGWIFWYLLSFGYFLLNFLIWYFNADLVTNKKVVDIDFHNLTYKEVSSTHLGKVQDVNFRVGGVIRHIFNYGDVFIQTAGSEPNFEFHAVPKPAFVADKLTDLMSAAGGTT